MMHTVIAEPNTAANQACQGEHRPFEAPVRANYVLTGPGSDCEKRHVEIELSGSGFSYEPGDALAILPRNDPRLVEHLIARLGLSEHAVVSRGGTEMPLSAALSQHVEVAVASPRFLRHWALLSGSAALRALTLPENTEARRLFLRANHISDIARDYPVRGLDAEMVLAGFRPLQPRLYSVASSLAETPGRAAITTSTLRYRLHGEWRCGVTSGYQVPRARLGDTLSVFVDPQPDFRLPADAAPVIMVGAGTGVAPFRAFLAERRVRGAPGRAWLIMGARTARSDFIYQSDWETQLASGHLSRLDLAFSRDGASKIYVQDRLREHGAAVFAWLEEGASIYVCGDAAGMAPGVHAALIEIIETHGGCAHEAAMGYLRRVAREHRYQRSIY